MTLSRKQIITIILLLAIVFALPVAVFLTRKKQDIRPKAQVAQAGSTLSFEGPQSVKTGETFNVNIMLNTNDDSQYNISGADAVVSFFGSGIIGIAPINPGGPLGVESGTATTKLAGTVTGGGGTNVAPTLSVDQLAVLEKRIEQANPGVEVPIGSQFPYPYPFYGSPVSLVKVNTGSIFDTYSIGNYLFPPVPISGSGAGGTSITGVPVAATNGTVVQPFVTGSEGVYTGPTIPSQPIGIAPENPPGPIEQQFPFRPQTQFTISGKKNFAVDQNGYFKGFIGNGTFATLTFVAKRPGKIEIGFVPGTSIKGYLVSQPASSQEPGERLLSISSNLSIEVVSDSTCIPRPSCLDSNPRCLMPESAEGWCPPVTPGFCKTGVNSFVAGPECPAGFLRSTGSPDIQYAQSAKYSCYDGYSGTVGGPDQCWSVGELSKMAQEACLGRSSCPLPNKCQGQPDGTSCTIGDCPVCPAGSETCSMRPCSLTLGICQNQKCIPGSPPPGPTCTPRPPCVDGIVGSNGEKVYCALDLMPGGWLCPKPGESRKSEGDADGDGAINGSDYIIWLNSQCAPGANQKCASLSADFNGDNRVDDSDYDIWFANRGTVTINKPTPSCHPGEIDCAPPGPGCHYEGTGDNCSCGNVVCTDQLSINKKDTGQ